MPIIKSAKKRVRVARKAAVRNSKTKRSLREAWKAFAASPSSKAHSAAQSRIAAVSTRAKMSMSTMA